MHWKTIFQQLLGQRFLRLPIPDEVMLVSEQRTMDYEKQLQIKTSELENLQKSFEEYVESSKELEAELENALAMTENSLKDTEKKLAVSESKFKQANEQLSRVNQENNQLQNELKQFQDKVSNLETRKRALENENEDINNQLRIAEATEEDLRHKLANAEEDAIYLKTDIFELKEEHRQTEELLRGEIKTIREQLEKALRGSKSPKSDQGDSKALDDSLEIEHITADDNCESCVCLEMKIQDLQETISELDSKNNQLQQKITELNLSLISYNTTKNPNASEADIVRVLRDEIDNLNDMVTQKDFEIQGLAQIKDDLAAKDDQIRYLEREFMEANKSTFGMFKASSVASKPLPSSMKKAANSEIIIDSTRSMQQKLQLLMNSVDIDALKSEFAELTDKFEQERAMNINLLNKIQSVRGNILVCCRSRPASDQEVSAGGKMIVDSSNEYELMFFDNRSESWKSFAFDRVWKPETAQSDIFSDVEPLAVSVTDGFNSCIIAYGQTGSGKTYTMDGYDEEYGVSYRTLNKIFEILEAKKLKKLNSKQFAKPKGHPLHPNTSSSPSKTPAKDFQPISSMYSHRDSDSTQSSRPGTPRSISSSHSLSHSGTSTPTYNHSDMKRQPASFEFINPMNRRQSLNTSSLLSPTPKNDIKRPLGNTSTPLHFPSAETMIVHDIPTVEYDFFDAEISSINSVDPVEVEEEDHFKYCVEISMMEIYNEQVYDLLNDNLGGGQTDGISLDIRMGPDNTVSVPDLKQVPVTNMDEVNKVFNRGAKNRATATTNLNNNSSRSHLIIQVEVTIEETENTVVKGRLFLVDLAGSERLNKSGAKGVVLKEAQYINKSLSALGDVMEALDQKQKHIPYRNSKLTYLLQNALGGNARTMMIFNVCPTNMTADETLFTLQFSSRVRNIQLGAAHRNVNAKNLEMALKNIRTELKDAKKKKLQLEELLNESKREQKRTFDKITIPLENKIKTLEEAKKVSDLLQNQLQKQVHDSNSKMLEDKQLRQQLASELEYSQQRIREISQQVTDSTNDMKKLNTIIRKREDEISRLQNVVYAHSMNGHGEVAQSVSSPRNGTPSEKKVMFAESPAALSPGVKSTFGSTTAGSKSTYTPPSSVLKRSIEIPAEYSQPITLLPGTTVTPLKPTSKDNMLSSTTPSATKSKTPVMSKVASLFQRNSSQSPGPSKVAFSSPTTTTDTIKATPYQRVLRAISPGLNSSLGGSSSTSTHPTAAVNSATSHSHSMSNHVGSTTTSPVHTAPTETAVVSTTMSPSSVSNEEDSGLKATATTTATTATSVDAIPFASIHITAGESSLPASVCTSPTTVPDTTTTTTATTTVRTPPSYYKAPPPPTGNARPMSPPTSVSSSNGGTPGTPGATSSFGRITSVLARSEEALRRHQMRMEKKREVLAGEKFKKI